MSVVSSGSVSLANIRASIIAGTAFIDFSSAGALTPYLLHKLTIKDSALKELVGYIKAAGTAETLSGTEKITDWANNGTYPFETLTESGTDITSAINTTGYGMCHSYNSSSSGQLHKLVSTITINSGALLYLVSGIDVFGSAPAVIYESPVTSGNKVIYRTITDNRQDQLAFLTGSGVAVNFSAVSNSLKQVITPSATGVTIVSAQGGSTFDWTSETSAFNRNDAAGYTYEIDDTGVGPAIGSLMLMGLGR